MLTLEEAGPIQMGFWVPNRVWATAKYMVPLFKSIEEKRKAGELPELEPVMQNFQKWVNSNPKYLNMMNLAIAETNTFINSAGPEVRNEINRDGDWAVGIKNFDFLVLVINSIIITSPSFNMTTMVGTPLNGLFAVMMGTTTGNQLFHDSTFNQQLKLILNAWNRFLKSEASREKIDQQHPDVAGSWLTTEADAAGVWKDMKYDAQDRYRGFKSWNDFFIREFLPSARPFAGAANTHINIGCETTPWHYQNNLDYKTDFTIKDAHYSLIDIFGGNKNVANYFLGGQAYQGFLSATHYHRWASPLSGELIQSYVLPGTYFAQRPGQGEVPGTWEGTESQPYLAEVATRAVFVFEHPTFGKVAMVLIGMVEVSTCYIEPAFRINTQDPSKTIQRGVDIGHFEFGGSTHMLIFQKDPKIVLADWAVNAAKHQNDKLATKMGTIIATYKA